jgi:hypothetical protein
MPGQKIGNSLAESWTESPDGLVYEFKLRQGPRLAEHTINSIPLHPGPAFQNMRLKGQ